MFAPPPQLPCSQVEDFFVSLIRQKTDYIASEHYTLFSHLPISCQSQAVKREKVFFWSVVSWGCFGVMLIIYFPLVIRTESVGCWMMSACSILEKQLGANDTASWHYSYRVWCRNLQENRVSECVPEWVRVETPDISFRILIISTSWHVLIVYI